MLIKPAAQVLIIAFLAAAVCQPKRRWVGLAFLITYAMCVVPWMARNNAHYGMFTMSAIATTSFYFYTAQGSVADYSWQELEARVNTLDTMWSQKSLPPLERKQQMEREAWSLIRDNWPLALKQAAVGFARTSFGTSRETLVESLGRKPNPGWVSHTAMPLVQICFLWMFAAIGTLAAVFRESLLSRPVLVLFVAAVILAMLPASNLVANARFRVPVAPILCVLAALGTTQASSRLKKGPGNSLHYVPKQ